jgi:hypothetical protein
MRLASNSRESVAGAVSLFLGLTVAAVLKVGFLVPAAAPVTAKGSQHPTPSAVRVRAKAAALPRVAQARPKPPAAPVSRPKAVAAVREVPVQSSAAPVTRTPALAPPLIEVAPSLALEQPALVPPLAVTTPEVPLPLPEMQTMATTPAAMPAAGPVGEAMGRPDTPPDDYAPPPKTFVEQPGGDVLVLGLLLDSKGHPLDVQILVPSYDTAADTTYAMAVLNNQTFTGIEPAILPGESRWIETRVYYPKRNILP